MTQEQYKRVSEINQRLMELEKVKAAIRPESVKLDYYETSRNIYITSETDNLISDILEHHDGMIRDEIDAEIKELYKEIEKL